MSTVNFSFEEVKNKIDEARSITILSHINPDADTLGTALGIFALLIKHNKRVEVVNASTELPNHLDFLPNFSKIKHKMDYKDSLVITCDCGSIDRLGFDLDGRDIINIDHHKSNTHYGSINVIVAQYASASQVAFALFEGLYKMSKDAVTCFYTALLSDTRYFTTASVNEEVFRVANVLVSLGAQPEKIAYHFTQRRSLASIRVLEKALSTLTLHKEARVASMCITKEDIASTGATVPDMEGIVDYARSLATVEIGILVMQLKDSVRISLRSKELDISQVALALGGGGHKVAAGFSLFTDTTQESLNIVLKQIESMELL